MPKLEGQGATQGEYLSGATPQDCEETNWHNAGLQKTLFSIGCFKSAAFRNLPIFHADSFTGTTYARQFIKPPGLARISQLAKTQEGACRGVKKKKKECNLL